MTSIAWRVLAGCLWVCASWSPEAPVDATPITAISQQTTVIDESTPSEIPASSSSSDWLSSLSLSPTTATFQPSSSGHSSPSPILHTSLSSAVSTSDVGSSPPVTTSGPPWKTLTFVFIGLASVVIVVAVILACCLCRLKGSLHKAHTTMYPEASDMSDPVYNESKGSWTKKKKAVAKVELKHFTSHSERVEEEIDSPTISPTPPPVRTLPPQIHRASTDSETPPAVVSRPKRRPAPPPLPTVGTDAQHLPPGTSNRSNQGQTNLAFESDARSGSEPHLKPNSSSSPTHGQDADDIYEEYLNEEYENTKPGADISTEATGTMETDDIEIDDLDAYEEPVPATKPKSYSQSHDYFVRQSSMSGLPESKPAKTPPVDSPLKILSERGSSGSPTSDADDIETLDDLTNYDEVDFSALTPDASQVSFPSGEIVKFGTDTDGLNYENMGRQSAARNISAEQPNLYGNESFDSVASGGMEMMGNANEDPSAPARYPGETDEDDTREDNGSNSDESDAAEYENYDVEQAMQSLQKGDVLPNQAPSEGADNITDDFESGEKPFMPQPMGSNSPPPLPNSPPPIPTTEPPEFDPPLPTSPPPPLPKVPPRKDLMTKTLTSETDETNYLTDISEQSQFSVKLDVNFGDVVDLRPKSGCRSREGSGHGVDSNPRDSYFTYRDDKTQFLCEDNVMQVYTGGDDAELDEGHLQSANRAGDSHADSGIFDQHQELMQNGSAGGRLHPQGHSGDTKEQLFSDHRVHDLDLDQLYDVLPSSNDSY